MKIAITTKIFRLRRYPTLWKKMGYRPPPPPPKFNCFPLSRLRNSPTNSPPPPPLSRLCQIPKITNPSEMRTIAVFCPRFATISLCQIPKITNLSEMITIAVFCPRFANISLVPDSEGHKPKHNKNNRYGVTQQQNKLLSNSPFHSLVWETRQQIRPPPHAMPLSCFARLRRSQTQAKWEQQLWCYATA